MRLCACTNQKPAYTRWVSNSRRPDYESVMCGGARSIPLTYRLQRQGHAQTEKTTSASATTRWTSRHCSRVGPLPPLCRTVCRPEIPRGICEGEVTEGLRKVA